MSPTSVCYTVTKTEADPLTGSLAAAGDVGSKLFQFGIRKQENVRVLPLKVSKDSHRIRKPPLPLPQVQYRPPVIIHTYSPKVIHTQPDDFMSLVQKLTGSSDTRLRLKRSPSKKEKSGGAGDSTEQADVESSVITDDPERQGSGITSTANCGSPSSSEDSAFPSFHSSCGADPLMKQSDSPRGPLAPSCEFLNPDVFFSSFDGHSSANSIFSNVKSEPSFSFNDNSFNFLTDFAQSTGNKAPKPSLPRPPLQDINPFNIDINSPLPSPGFLSPGLMAGLPDLSPSTATCWSQSFLDCYGGSAPVNHMNQAPLPRQRYSGGYSPAPEGNMVALENIQAFMLS